MALWQVRAGRYGERESLALEKGLDVIGLGDLPDLSGVGIREELYELLEKTYSEEKRKTLLNWLSQIQVAGPYQYRSDFPLDTKHTCPMPAMLAPISMPGTSEAGEWEAPPDLEQYARDQIRDFIARKFKGHNLDRLVGAVLEAQGYKVQISPEGVDGGVDILAGYGPMVLTVLDWCCR